MYTLSNARGIKSISANEVREKQLYNSFNETLEKNDLKQIRFRNKLILKILDPHSA